MRHLARSTTRDDLPSLPPAAGATRRAAATVLDMAIFCAASAAMAWPTIRSVDWTQAYVGIDVLAAELSDPTWSSHAASVAGLWIAFWWCYFAVGWGLAGATPGKWLVGLRVIDHRGGSPIGVPRALLRLVAYTMSSLTLGVGHTLVVLRRDHRALHDILAGTRVVSRRRWREWAARQASARDASGIPLGAVTEAVGSSGTEPEPAAGGDTESGAGDGGSVSDSDSRSGSDGGGDSGGDSDSGSGSGGDSGNDSGSDGGRRSRSS